MEHENRRALELANADWCDAQDYLQRYRFTVKSKEPDYWNNKSRRMKVYIDLRMAIETILKSMICLSTKAGTGGDDRLRGLRKLRHNVSNLVDRTEISLNNELVEALKKCDSAPVDWRYEADAREAREKDERDYSATVGSDAWMNQLEDFVAREVNALGTNLQAYSGIHTASEVLERIQARTKGNP